LSHSESTTPSSTTTSRPATAWPCPTYCGRCEACHQGAEREAAARERQLEVYSLHRVGAFVSWGPADREGAKRTVLENIRHTSGSGSLIAGLEVDVLVAGLEQGHPDLQWRVLGDWLTALAWARAASLFPDTPQPMEVEDVVSDTLQKVVRALAARSFLAVGGTTSAEAPWAWQHCFTHVYPFRPWVSTVLTNAARDGARKGSHSPDTVPAADERVQYPASEASSEDPDNQLVIHRMTDLLALVAEQHKSGERRADHMRHTLARLPWRYVAAIDASNPALRIGDLPAAGNDAQMAGNLETTVQNVRTTRSNYRRFIALRQPDLAPTLEVILSIALGSDARPS
jgi:DNA-directed RNA polymerase specialized sigma24 family protein